MMAESAWTEEEYREYLETERRLFAWTLTNYSDTTAAEAERKANEFYEYEPCSKKMRSLVFHDEAWHWAMISIHGGGYWHAHPEHWPPPPEYQDAKTNEEA